MKKNQTVNYQHELYGSPIYCAMPALNTRTRALNLHAESQRLHHLCCAFVLGALGETNAGPTQRGWKEEEGSPRHGAQAGCGGLSAEVYPGISSPIGSLPQCIADGDPQGSFKHLCQGLQRSRTPLRQVCRVLPAWGRDGHNPTMLQAAHPTPALPTLVARPSKDRG